ncbi:MAG: AI-2E family transporter [Proteobacteria bacterium]|nr:AI-2E family transporter [Pseudomonadota bacterium]
MTTNAVVQRWQWLFIVLAVGFLLWLLAPVLTPFVIAAMLAYLGDPLANRLQRLHCNRTVATSIVFLVMVLVLVGSLVLLVPLIERQVVRLIGAMPVYAAWVKTHLLPWLQQRLHLPADAFDFEQIMGNVRAHIGTIGNVAAAAIGYATRSGLTLIGWAASLVLIPVVTFYLLRDWHLFVAKIDELLPRTIEPTVARLVRESDAVLGAFVRGQLLVMIALAVYYAVALWAIGLDVGPLIGMIAGLVSFVPYLGFITGLLASVIAALVQYHDWPHLLMVLAVFGIGQVLEGYVLVPRLVGGKIGLHPVAVIFAIMAFGQLFGFIGVLLALPMASVLTVLLRYAYERYTASALYDARAASAAEHAPVIAPALELEPVPEEQPEDTPRDDRAPDE